MLTDSSIKFNERSLFVGDLSFFCTEDDLLNALSPFGAIDELKIKRSKHTNASLCYGFVTFQTSDAAVTAMKELSGSVLCGRLLRLNWASSYHIRDEDIEVFIPIQPMRIEKYEQRQVPQHTQIDPNIPITIHLKFYSQNEFTLNETYLKNTFSLHGNVIHVMIKRYAVKQETGENSGYAFLYFEKSFDGIAAAVKTAETFKDTVVNRIRFKASVTKALAAYIQKLNNQLELHDNSVVREYYSLSNETTKKHSQMQSHVADKATLLTHNQQYYNIQQLSYPQQQHASIEHIPYQFAASTMRAPFNLIDQQHWASGRQVNYSMATTPNVPNEPYIPPSVSYYPRQAVSRSYSNFQSDPDMNGLSVSLSRTNLNQQHNVSELSKLHPPGNHNYW
eukprot:gene14233-19098_t